MGSVRVVDRRRGAARRRSPAGMVEVPLDIPQVSNATALLSPAQIRSIVRSTARINLWTGAIRSGKTVASLLRWLAFIATAPRSGQLVMIGQTKDTVYRNLFAVLQDPEVFGPLCEYVHYTQGSNTAKILGRTVHILGAHDVKAEKKLRGLTVIGAYVDEATLIGKTFWTQLLGRMSKTTAKLFATTNPDNPAHWLRKDFILQSIRRGGKIDLNHYHFTLLDNPGLEAEIRENYRAEFVGLWYKRFILGWWVAAEGAIFDDWDANRHVVDTLPPILRWIAAGVDYGTTNPFAAILLGLGDDRTLYAVSEYWYDQARTRRRKDPEAYADAMVGWLDDVPIPGTTLTGVRPEYIAVDPAEAAFIQTLYGRGLAPTSARNEVINGIRNVSSLLARNRLKIHESCRNLIAEIPGYSWDDKESEKGHDKPIKANDHAIDALRYGVHTTEALWRSAMNLELAA